MCDSVIPDSIAAGGCLLVEQAAQHMKTNSNPTHETLAHEAQT